VRISTVALATTRPPPVVLPMELHPRSSQKHHSSKHPPEVLLQPIAAGHEADVRRPDGPDKTDVTIVNHAALFQLVAEADGNRTHLAALAVTPARVALDVMSSGKGAIRARAGGPEDRVRVGQRGRLG